MVSVVFKEMHAPGSGRHMDNFCRGIEVKREVADKISEIKGLVKIINDKEAHIVNLSHAIWSIQNSTSWKVTAPLRAIIHKIKRQPQSQSMSIADIQSNPYLDPYPNHVFSDCNEDEIQDQGVAGFSPEDDNSYSSWIRKHDTLSDYDRLAIYQACGRMKVKPLFSIIMPVYNPPIEMLERAIESIQQQIYSNWELCIADDASTDPRVRLILTHLSNADHRIKVVYRKENGHISEASNSAISIANGDFIVLMDNDDEIPEHALYWLAKTVNENPRAAIIYSDEDKIDIDGNRSGPYFKTDWNIYLFRSHNMISHLGVYLRSLVSEVGGFRVGFEGSQDYDLALRCIEKVSSDQILHIPKVLYHWRIHAGSTALSSDEKPYAQTAGERALNEHLQRIGNIGRAELLDFGMYRVHYDLPKNTPLVSLIIPTRNAVDLVRQCIESIHSKTTYRNYEIILVDNGSDDDESIKYFGFLETLPGVRVIRDDSPFNYSALNNKAVSFANGEIVGLINNDIEVISPGWLDEMVSLAMQPGSGAVGARLWYPNDKLQHGGVIMGPLGLAGHSHKMLQRGHHGYFGRASLIQGFSAVTAACLIVKKSIFEEVGGLNEVDLKIAFNDVDLCLKIMEAGYQNIWTPNADLYHHESATRGYEDTPQKIERFNSEVSYMQKRWRKIIDNDPFYNPNLTLESEGFSIGFPPRKIPTQNY